MDDMCGVSDFFFVFKQKTAYEMRISDWSSDVCSSDLDRARRERRVEHAAVELVLRRVLHRGDPVPVGLRDRGDRGLAAEDLVVVERVPHGLVVEQHPEPTTDRKSVV